MCASCSTGAVFSLLPRQLVEGLANPLIVLLAHTPGGVILDIGDVAAVKGPRR
jgi:hypothetical protein